MNYSGTIRLAVEKPCYVCLTGATYKVIDAMQRLKVYTFEGAQHNREIFIDICSNRDTLAIRSIFFKFFWQLPDNFTDPILKHAMLEWILVMLEAKYRVCKKGKHQQPETYKALDELGLRPQIEGTFNKG